MHLDPLRSEKLDEDQNPSLLFSFLYHYWNWRHATKPLAWCINVKAVRNKIFQHDGRSWNNCISPLMSIWSSHCRLTQNHQVCFALNDKGLTPSDARQTSWPDVVSVILAFVNLWECPRNRFDLSRGSKGELSVPPGSLSLHCLSQFCAMPHHIQCDKFYDLDNFVRSAAVWDELRTVE